MMTEKLDNKCEEKSMQDQIPTGIPNYCLFTKVHLLRQSMVLIMKLTRYIHIFSKYHETDRTTIRVYLT